MSTITKRSKILPSRSKLSLATLPSNLKNSILDLVTYSDSINLIKTNKHLRNHYLYRGLLSKRVDFLKIIISSCHNDPIVLIETSVNKEGLLQCGQIEKNDKKSGKGFRISSKLKDLLLSFVSRIRTCKTLELEVKLYSESQNEKTLNKLFLEKKFLNIQYVANFEIAELGRWSFPLEDSSIISALLCDYYCPNVEKELKIYSDQELDEECEQIFAKEELKSCKALHFEKFLPNFRFLSLTTSTVYTIHDNLDDNDEICVAVDQFLDRIEILEKNPTVTVIFSNKREYPEDAKVTLNEIILMLKEKEMEWIDLEAGALRSIGEFELQKSNVSQDLLSLLEIEKKIDDMTFELFSPLIEKPYCRGCFCEKSKNWLVILRVSDVQTQIIVKAKPVEE